MKASVTRHTDKSQAELKIEVPAEDFQSFVEKAAKSLTTATPLKGFRPGKAPVAVVAEALGTERLLKEAMEKAMQKFFVQAVIEENVEAISRPNITVEKLGLHEPLHFTAIVDVMPEVSLKDLKDISIEKRTVSVSDEDVAKELIHLARMRSTYLDVARGAEAGDKVELDFEVTIDGALIEGGESKHHPVHLGEGHFVPDFEKGLLGIKADEERTFFITFPSDFANEKLRGAKAQVKARAYRVQKRVIPKADDAFAKQLGKFENLAGLQAQLKKNIQHEREHRERERYQGELMQAVAKAATYGPIPPVLIERELEERVREFSDMLRLQQKTVEEYAREHNKDATQVREEMRPAAEKAVKVALAMRAFSEQYDIKVTPKEIEEKTNEYLAQFGSVEEAKKRLDPHAMRDEIAALLRNQKTLAKLEEIVAASNNGEKQIDSI